MDAMRRGDKKSNLAYNKVRDILAKAPAVDIGSVVRCCECRKRYTSECPICAADSGFCTQDYGHCHYGAREMEG